MTSRTFFTFPLSLSYSRYLSVLSSRFGQPPSPVVRTSYVNVPLAFTTVVNPEAAVAALPPFGLSINLALSECHFIGAALLLRCHAEARVARVGRNFFNWSWSLSDSMIPLRRYRILQTSSSETEIFHPQKTFTQDEIAKITQASLKFCRFF